MIWMGEIFKVVRFLLPKPVLEVILENLEALHMIDMMVALLQKQQNVVVIINVVYVYVERNVGLTIVVRDLDHVIVIEDDLVLHPVDVLHHLVDVAPLHLVVDHHHLDDDHLNPHLDKNNALLRLLVNNNVLLLLDVLLNLVVDLLNLHVVVLLNLQDILLNLVVVLLLQNIKMHVLQ